MSTEWHKRLIERQPKYVRNKINERMKTEDWVIWALGDCPNSDNTLVHYFIRSFDCFGLHHLSSDSQLGYNWHRFSCNY